MQKLDEILQQGIRKAFGTIMKTNCYEVEIKDECKSYFTIPSFSENVFISVNCHLNVFNFISIEMQTPFKIFSFIFDFLPDGKIQAQLNGIQIKDLSWINFDPVERHCKQLIKDLNLPPCSHTQEF